MRRSERYVAVCSSIILGTFAATYVDRSLFVWLSFLVGVTAGLFVTFELLPARKPEGGDAG